ncbi:MAG: double-strand break repair helicase AddA [Alphaproteobacteria bacterium]|nr:double-strand break repair helicase AddA [Alphaproteobacteria bacterium]
MSQPLKKQDAQPQAQEATKYSKEQLDAANPAASVWVSASAGSGKTTVLTARLLRLLLPDDKAQRAGLPPHKILCLTFTKAGATNMQIKLQNKLGAWATMEDATLLAELQALLSRDPTENELQAARALFANVLDAPGGIRIMTLHGFCESVLKRFPLESGVSPHFEILEDFKQKDLLAEAQRRVFSELLAHPDTQKAQNTARLQQAAGAHALPQIITSILGERLALMELPKQNLHQHYLKTFGLDQFSSEKDIIKPACDDAWLEAHHLSEIRALIQMQTGKKTLPVATEAFLSPLNKWCALNPEERLANWHILLEAIVTKSEKTIRKNLKAADSAQQDYFSSLFFRFAEAIWALELQKRDYLNALHTADALELARDILAHYTALKETVAALDYDDLIIKTLELLRGKGFTVKGASAIQWILYKLDEGLEHLLIDEAQDTNPEQWDITRILVSEFFSGNTRETDGPRTLFTVGDEKQSIFSFQRAAPEEFERNHIAFREQAQLAQRKWEDVSLHTSYRSAAEILSFTDAVFNNSTAQNGVVARTLTHTPAKTHKGYIELWDLELEERAETRPAWQLPTEITEQSSRMNVLAERIAQTADSLIKQGRAKAGDIMVLFRSRNTFVKRIIKAFRKYNIPTSGLDRFKLDEDISVHDILCAAEFALLPQDDLTLAALLKSPFIRLDDDALYTLAYNRGTKTLYTRVREDKPEIATWLAQLVAAARDESAYFFLHSLINAPCPADPQGTGLRALLKRLGAQAREPVFELLGKALELYQNEPEIGLQTLIHKLRNIPSEMKREMEDHGNLARFMTIYGSKGLEAPIVFLVDTCMSGRDKNKDSTFLWQRKSGLPLPLWARNKDSEGRQYQTGAAHAEELMLQEYNRLLYVALTRAERELYICGYAKSKPSEHSWYHKCAAGMQSLTTASHYGTIEKTPVKTEETGDPEVTLPAWLFTKAQASALAPKRLTPSKLQEEEDKTPAFSPLALSDKNRFLRGTLTHKLLQLLPEANPATWETAGAKYLASYAHDLSDETRQNILDETLRVLRDETFAPIFGTGSLAEVPVSGILPDGRLLSGQIDRLLITESRILIIDYKTNRPSPQNSQDVPKTYINQMNAYKNALAAIYPGRTIVCGLLWTDEAKLMLLDGL